MDLCVYPKGLHVVGTQRTPVDQIAESFAPPTHTYQNMGHVLRTPKERPNLVFSPAPPPAIHSPSRNAFLASQVMKVSLPILPLLDTDSSQIKIAKSKQHHLMLELKGQHLTYKRKCKSMEITLLKIPLRDQRDWQDW